MANEYAQFLTPWAQILEEGESINTPGLGQLHSVRKWQDITGQPAENLFPSPNGYIIEVWADTATMDAINADQAFVLIPETRVDLDAVVPDPDPENPTPPPPSEVPDQPAFDAFRAAITAVFNPVIEVNVWTQGQVDAAIGTTVNGRTWEQINGELKAYCQAAPKGAQTYRIQPVDLPDGSVGFSADGGDLEPAQFFGVDIVRVATHPLAGGLFAVELASTIPLEYVEFPELGLNIADAWIQGNTALWAGTGFEFNAGIDYGLIMHG